MMWIVGLASAFGVKLSSSIDDVVWLAPFLTSNVSYAARVQSSLIYTGVCLIQTLVAMAIAYSGRKAVAYLTGGNKHAWSTEKILTVGAGCLLALYSLKLTYEYIQELREGGEEENGDENPESGSYSKVATTEGAESATGLQVDSKKMLAPAIDSPEKAEGELDKAEKDNSQTLFVIAFIGSVDDLTLFVPMLVGKGFDLIQLVLGAFAAAATIVMLCLFIGLCKPIADCLSKIPLALIVVGFACVLLVKGFLFEGEVGAAA